MESENRIDWMSVAKVIAIVVIVGGIGIFLLYSGLVSIEESRLKKEYCKDQGGVVSHTTWEGVYCDFPSEGMYIRYVVEMDENKQFRLVK